MGILDNALAGAAKGLVDFGTMYMKEGMQERADERQLERQRILQQEQYALMEEREKRLAEFKVDLADKVREREMQRLQSAVGDVTGISGRFDAARAEYAKGGTYDDGTGNQVPIGDVSGQIDTMEKGAIAQAMGDKSTVRQAAMSIGDFDTAKAIGDEKLHNVSPGQVVIDEKGNKVFDNTDALINKLRTASELKTSEAAAKAGLKSADPIKAGETLTKLDEGARKAVNELLKDERHPYADPDDEKSKDKAKQKVVTEATALFKKSSIANGKAVSDYDAAEMALAKVTELDTANRKLVDAAKSALFDERGELKNKPLAEKLKGTGISFESPDKFAQTYRDSKLSMRHLEVFRKNPEDYMKKIDSLISQMSPQQQSVNKYAVQPDESGIVRRPGLIDRVINGKEVPKDFDPKQLHSKQSSSGKIQFNK